MSPVHCIHKIHILRVTSKVYFKELLRLIGQDLRLLGRGLGLGLDNIVSLLPFSDFCKANLSSIKQSINQWSIPTHHPLAGAYLSNTYHFKINMDLISFHSLMRALLNCLICSSSSMMDCSSHSIFLQISFILTSLFIFLLWLVSSNFFVSLIAFFWLSNTFASFSTCLLWLFKWHHALRPDLSSAVAAVVSSRGQDWILLLYLKRSIQGPSVTLMSIWPHWDHPRCQGGIGHLISQGNTRIWMMK